MSQQKDITEFVLNEFSELVNRWGFQPPKVTAEDWITRIDYFKGDLGFEIELDWRDFDLFALLVRLENGCLPSGYYVSNGRRCRKHLNNVIREQRWSQMRRQAPSKMTRTIADIKETADETKRTLLAHLDRIIQAGDTIFESQLKSAKDSK